jgi:hypothetical protein
MLHAIRMSLLNTIMLLDIFWIPNDWEHGFPHRAITSHLAAPALAHIRHTLNEWQNLPPLAIHKGIACILEHKTTKVKDFHFFVYQLDSII